MHYESQEHYDAAMGAAAEAEMEAMAAQAEAEAEHEMAMAAERREQANMHISLIEDEIRELEHRLENLKRRQADIANDLF